MSWMLLHFWRIFFSVIKKTSGLIKPKILTLGIYLDLMMVYPHSMTVVNLKEASMKFIPLNWN